MNLQLSVDVNELARKAVIDEVRDLVNCELVEEFIDSYVEMALDKQIMSDDYDLKETILEAIRPEVMGYFEANLYKEDLMDCMKEAVLERLRELPFEELKGLFEIIVDNKKIE